MATLYLVRHGTTKYNYHGDPKQDRVKGTMDVPLDERGKMVAHQAADQLAKLGVTHVITPDLARGLETAHIISQKTGAKIAVSSRLRPWDVGMFRGEAVLLRFTFPQALSATPRRDSPERGELQHLR
jgi:broad specificity phosphatase PhoE